MTLSLPQFIKQEFHFYIKVLLLLLFSRAIFYDSLHTYFRHSPHVTPWVTSRKDGRKRVPGCQCRQAFQPTFKHGHSEQLYKLYSCSWSSKTLYILVPLHWTLGLACVESIVLIYFRSYFVIEYSHFLFGTDRPSFPYP